MVVDPFELTRWENKRDAGVEIGMRRTEEENRGLKKGSVGINFKPLCNL